LHAAAPRRHRIRSRAGAGARDPAARARQRERPQRALAAGPRRKAHRMIYAAARKLLFRLDAESVHDWTVEQIRRVEQVPIAVRLIERFCAAPASPVRLWDLTFRNPIGIAAGFDKNAVMMPLLAALGFGFIEVGTVTLRPQPGNPKPRLFRDPPRRALINRLGFNNDGADAVAERLKLWR